MRGPETRLRYKIEKALKKEWPRGYFRKIHGNQFQNAGIMDLICCVNGRFIGLEIKTIRGKVTLIQTVEIKLVLRASGYAAVVRTVEEALEAVRTAIKRPLGPQ